MTRFTHDAVVPYVSSKQSKKEQVAGMFDDIAFRYDFLNRFLSIGIDQIWRKKLIAELKEVNPRKVLDVATGTGDVAIMTAKRLDVEKITGIDISQGMLEIGRKKITKLLLIKTFKKLAHGLHPIKRTTTRTRVATQRQNKNKKLQKSVRQQKQ